jgi:hypothetical protein
VRGKKNTCQAYERVFIFTCQAGISIAFGEWLSAPLAKDVTPSENMKEHKPSAMSSQMKGYVRYTTVKSK